MSNKRIIVVLGMHRSGTSAIARGLKALSVELGDNLMPAVPNNNDRGFWEDMDVYKFNERLFARLGTAWDRLSVVSDSPLSGQTFSAERYEAATLIERKLSKIPVFGVKDPRMSVLLPFWKCIFEDLALDDQYIVALRNPLEVAESLRQRDRFDTTLGLLLWLKYTWAAVQNSADRKRVFVSYRKLVDDPTLQLSRIASTLDLPTPSASSPAMLEYLSEFLTPELLHHRISDLELKRQDGMPAAIKDLYSLLDQWSETAEQTSAPHKLAAGIDTFLATSRPMLELCDRLKLRLASSEKSHLDISTTAEKLKTSVTERDQRIIALTTSESALKQHASTIEERLKAAASSLSERDQRIFALSASEAGLKQHASDVENRLKAAASSLSERDQKILALSSSEAELRNRLKNLEAEMATLIASRDEAEMAKLQLKAAKQELSDASARDAATSALVNELRSEAERLRFELAQNTNRISEFSNVIELLKKQVSTGSDEQQKTDAKLKQAELLALNRLNQLRECQTALNQARDNSAKLESSLQTHAADLSAMTTSIRLLRHEVLQLRTSSSWRVTKPLRAIKGVLTQLISIHYRRGGNK